MTAHRQARALQSVDAEIKADPFGWARQAARRGRHHWIDEPPAPECSPTFTLDRRIAEARESMGEAEWARLNAEWLATPEPRSQGEDHV